MLIDLMWTDLERRAHKAQVFGNIIGTLGRGTIQAKWAEGVRPELALYKTGDLDPTEIVPTEQAIEHLRKRIAELLSPMLN